MSHPRGVLVFLFKMFSQGGLIPTYLLIGSIGLIDNPGTRGRRHQLANSVEVVLPLSGPTIAAITLFYALVHWNTYFNALIYLRTTSRWPLQLMLREILSINSLAATTDGRQHQGGSAADDQGEYLQSLIQLR